ncbi:MAG: sigma-70 family RNA polymerase sigma factor [Oscillospiraceae bacterium]|nr:sigma-70 family RNA polymerase sigma factor [Candidatus Ruminococcus equi]
MTNSKEFKEKIYTEYYKKVFGYILEKVNNSTLAEDIAGDVFLKVYEKLDTFDESKSSLSTWIFTITRNTLIDYYRTRRVDEEIPEEFSEEFTVEDELCQSETLDELADALYTLSESERDVIIFHYYSDMSFKDIADKMDMSYSYVRYLHTNALKKLRKKL